MTALFLQSFFLSAGIHCLLLYFFIFTLPAPSILFKPSAVFLGGIFKKQELFDFKGGVDIQDRNKARLSPAVDINPRLESRAQSRLDKPEGFVPDAPLKDSQKTLFELPVNPSTDPWEDSLKREKFILKPLTLENND